MFTGLVEEIGCIQDLRRGGQSVSLTIRAKKVLAQTRIGDSIAVNGICLTVTALSADSFSADVMPETLRRSSLSQLKPKSPVNLERAMRMGDRLGGHLVSGHIDGTGKLAEKNRDGNALRIRINATPALTKYIIEKGSVALDGVSLTVVSVDRSGFEVSLIPHTAGQPSLGQSQPGDLINIECDPIGKYVEKLLFNDQAIPGESKLSRQSSIGSEGKKAIDWAFLSDNGF